jgi:hypothetical protein
MEQIRCRRPPYRFLIFDRRGTITSGGLTVKTIRNKTHAPLRVPLPRGKVLHLGPNQSGQIAHTDVDHEPLQKLVESGTLEVVDDKSAAAAVHDQEKGPHEDPHGHHPPTGSQVRGDR